MERAKGKGDRGMRGEYDDQGSELLERRKEKRERQGGKRRRLMLENVEMERFRVRKGTWRQWRGRRRDA